MASSRTVSPWTNTPRHPGPAGQTGWYPVARSSAVGTAPLAVGAGGRPYVVLRLRPGAEVTALSARCPHRLVPLTAATVVDGRVQCPYHGWQFNAEGRCVDIPSLGPAGTPPPRADLSTPWAVEERDGWVWLAPEPTASARPPRSGSAPPAPEPVPELPGPTGPVLDNLHAALEHAWHPVALTSELLEGGYVQSRLLGRTWTVHRHRGGELTVEPPAWGVVERDGVVRIAPAEPRDEPIGVPAAADELVTSGWLLPVRTVAPAGPLADAFLDTAHRPFVHAATSGADAPQEVPVPDLTLERGGFSNVQDDGRHRTTLVHRAPFQLLRRHEDRATGRATTVLRLLQPEDADSTRVYTQVLLRHPGGTAPAAALSEAVALEAAVLAEDLELMAQLASTGLPLLPRAELHVQADRLGVALRRTLADLAADCSADELRHRATA